jgi:hypothetical protein
MIFNPNQTEFPSQKHKTIWDAGRQIVPFEVSIADIIDPEIREGCMQIYNWTQEYLELMYNEPDKYNGNPYSMFRLLDDIAENAEIINGGMAFSIKKYENQILKNPCLLDIPLIGLEITDNDGCKILINNKYPLFCMYFKLFYNASSKKIANRLEYLMCNDFRVFASKYKRSIDDLLRVLPDNLRSYVLGIHEYALSEGAKLESHKYYCHFRYMYKKQFVLMLSRNDGRDTPLNIAVPWRLKNVKGDSFDKFMQVVDSQPDQDELISYIQKEICACNACDKRKKASERCTNVWKVINGKRRLLSICHADICKWKAAKTNLQYFDYDIKMLKRLIDVRFQQIDNILE